MPTQDPTRKSRRPLWIGVLLGVCALVYFAPLFHVVPLGATRSESQAAAFDAAAFVETFWNERLPSAANSAMDAVELLAALETNLADAAERFGHRLGLSGATSYFVSGSGRIIAVESSAITIALDDSATQTVVIETGPLFGNAIRDGSGLLDINEFANSQEFNAISSEINRRVEERVFPLLKKDATVGVSVRFAGGVEIADSETDISALRLTPVIVEYR